MAKKKPPQWEYVSSSNLREVLYKDGNLYVKFKSGSVYLYMNVPLYTYMALLSAKSKGRYHYYNIRNSFPYRQVG